MVGIQDIISHRIKRQADEDDVYSEHGDGHFILAESAQQSCGEGDEGDQKEKQSVDVGEGSVYIFRIDGDEEMMRAPVGEEKGK